MLGKTYRWISRAKVAAWFREAFSLGTSDNKHGESPSVEKMREIRKSSMAPGSPQPKIFYILPRRDEMLTLEQDLKGHYNAEEESSHLDAAKEVHPNQVTKWMRTASGVFKEEYLEQCHAKLLEEAVKSTTNSACPSPVVCDETINQDESQ